MGEAPKGLLSVMQKLKGTTELVLRIVLVDLDNAGKNHTAQVNTITPTQMSLNKTSPAEIQLQLILTKN